MLALAKVDVFFNPIKKLPSDGSNLLYFHVARLLPSLLTPFNLALLGKMLRPLFYILLQICGFIILLRPNVFHHVIWTKMGHLLRWTILLYSPEYFAALLKVLTLALTAAIMYNPGTVAKSFSFIYSLSMLTMRLTLWFAVRVGSLMFKLTTQFARSAFRSVLRRFANKYWSKLPRYLRDFFR